MKWTPAEYQPSMVDWFTERTEAAWWVGMGMGKSVCMLTAASKLILEGAAKGVLLVLPIRVAAITIPSEVEKWDHLRWLRVANMRTEEGQRMWEDGSADIYMINPEQLPSIEKLMKCRKCKGGELGPCEHCDKGFNKVRTKGFVEKFIKGRKKIPTDILVVDEASLAKGAESLRFETLRNFLFDIVMNGKTRYRTPFKRRWSMTGTPSPNSYLDVFAQVRLMDNGKRLGTFYTSYQDKYFEKNYSGFGYKIRKGAKEEIEGKLADFALVLLSEDWLGLPTCTTTDIEVTLPKDAQKIYNTLEKEALVQLESGQIEALGAAALVIKLTQITSGCVYDEDKEVHTIHTAKLAALKDVRKKHPKEPLLVFTSYKHERDEVLKAFPEARKFHEKDMPEWKAGKIPMWVADARSLAHGIDGLQVSGRIAVWMSQTYSYEVYAQANARLVRTGQTKETIIYRILAKGTIDEAVVETLRSKEEGNSGLMLALKNLRRLKEG